MRDLKFLTAVKFQVEVLFWVMTPRSDVVGYQRFGGPWCVLLQCSVVVGYQRFGGPCCLHFRVKWLHPWRCCCPTTTLHGVTTQNKTSTWTCYYLLSSTLWNFLIFISFITTCIKLKKENALLRPPSVADCDHRITQSWVLITRTSVNLAQVPCGFP
jgi:hypothetical protein